MSPPASTGGLFCLSGAKSLDFGAESPIIPSSGALLSLFAADSDAGATGANAGAGEDCVSLGLIREFGGLRKGCPTLATP